MNYPMKVLDGARAGGEFCARGFHRGGMAEWDHPPLRSPTAVRPPSICSGHPFPVVFHALSIRIYATPERRVEGSPAD